MARSKARKMADGEMKLTRDGSSKLEANATGVDVTGTVTADQIDVEGSGVLFKAGGASYIDREVLTLSWNSNLGDYIQLNTPSADNESGKFTFGSNGDVSFYDTSGVNQKFFWDASAERLGIGTTSPSDELHVEGGTFRVKDGSSAIRFNEYQNGAYLWLDGSNGDFAGGDYFNIAAVDNTRMSFGYAGNASISLKSNGYVGIGTTTPDSELHVDTGTNGGVRIEGDSWCRLQLKHNTGHMGLTHDSFGLSVYDWETGGGYHTTFKEGGNVGIGTTSPQAPLHAKGNNQPMRIEGTGAGSWIDYYGSSGRAWSAGRANQDEFGFYDRTNGSYFANFKGEDSGSHYSFNLRSNTHFNQLCENDSSVNNGFRRHVIKVSSSAGGATTTIMRIRRNWWGSGNFQVNIRNTYYSGSEDVNYTIQGSTSVQYNKTMSIQNWAGDSANRLQLTSRSSSSPGNSTTGYQDVQIVVPAYYQYTIEILVAQSVYCTSDSELAGHVNGYRIMV